MKIKKNVNEQEYFSQLLNSIPVEVKESINLSMAIAVQINYILKNKKISQREFAAMLGKKESEISKWLSGNHNFTTNTIGKIQNVLGEDIITIPLYSKKEIKFIPIQSYSQSIQVNNNDRNINETFFTELSQHNLFNLIINSYDCYGA
jgi:transcriptional regulator with XRE-family HTH domain